MQELIDLGLEDRFGNEFTDSCATILFGTFLIVVCLSHGADERLNLARCKLFDSLTNHLG